MVTPADQPTVAAILVLGKEPQYWFPGAYIEARRVAGNSLTDETIDQREISSSLIDQAREADAWMDLHVLRPMTIGGPRHSSAPDYPTSALRQLIRNALMHRSYEGTNAPVRISWYEDRIEIQNPGGPYGQVTRANFGDIGITDYRNPTLAGLMKSLGFVERFGVGIQLARSELAKNGNPEPLFKVTDTHVHVTVRKRT